MSWLKVDDAFPEGPKARDLSDAALAMWLRCACWAQRAENLHFAGRIPRKALAGIAKKPQKAAEALAQELVEANAYGSKEHGLWEPLDDGWQIHDWEDYQPPPPTLTRSESASLAGKRSAEARRERNGTAQPLRRSEHPSNETESFGSRSEPRSTERRSDSGSVELNRTSRTPDPGPIPARPDPEASTLAGRLAAVERLPGAPPTPRKDPLGERISFQRWFPSQQWLDWTRELGISAATFDRIMAEARDKLTGSHDIEWWDIKLLRFFEVGAKSGAKVEQKKTQEDAAFERRQNVKSREIGDLMRGGA